MTTRIVRSTTAIAGTAAMVLLGTGLAAAAAGTAHAGTSALCEIDGRAISDPAVCFPNPCVPEPITARVYSPADCAAGTVAYQETVTTFSVTWNGAEKVWEVAEHPKTTAGVRPLTASEKKACAAGTVPTPAPVTPQPRVDPIPMPPTTTPTGPRPALVTRTYSVVTDSWKGHEAATRIQKAYGDGSFAYRELAWAWQTRTGRAQVTERHQQVKVTLPATATKAQWIAAVNKATTTVGDVRSTARVGHLADRGTLRTAWEVTPKSWQLGRDVRTHRAPQVFLARS